MRHSIRHVEKPLYANFHNFGTKTTTPIEFIDLEPDYKVKVMQICTLQSCQVQLNSAIVCSLQLSIMLIAFELFFLKHALNLLFLILDSFYSSV